MTATLTRYDLADRVEVRRGRRLLATVVDEGAVAYVTVPDDDQWDKRSDRRLVTNTEHVSVDAAVAFVAVMFRRYGHA